MADPYAFLRMQNIYGVPPMGNDLPEQGGITGNMFGASIFGPQNPMGMPLPQEAMPAGASPAIAADPTSGYDAGARMREIYNPEHAASDRYNQMIGAYPREQDYHPSVGRRIGGALTSLGGAFGPHGEVRFNPQSMQAGMNLRDEPYTDKLTDWKNQIGPAQTSANLERYENVNERQLAYQTVGREQAQQKEEARQREQDRKIKVQEARSKVYEWKSTHQGYTFDFRGPTVKAANKATGVVEDLGIPTGHMNEQEKLELQQDFMRENIGSRGAESQATAAVNVQGRKDVTEMGAWTITEINDPEHPGQRINVKINAITGEVKPITMGPAKTPVTGAEKIGTSSAASQKPETAQNRRVREYENARQLINDHPEWKPYIKFGGNTPTDVQVLPASVPGKLWGQTTGPSNADRATILKAIYGETNPTVNINKQDPSTWNIMNKPPNPNEQTVIPPGYRPPPGQPAQPTKPAPPTAQVEPKWEPGYISVYDVKTGQLLGSIPASDTSKLDTSKYTTVKPQGK